MNLSLILVLLAGLLAQLPGAQTWQGRAAHLGETAEAYLEPELGD